MHISLGSHSSQVRTRGVRLYVDPTSTTSTPLYRHSGVSDSRGTSGALFAPGTQKATLGVKVIYSCRLAEDGRNGDTLDLRIGD